MSDHFTVMFAGNIGDMQGLDVAVRAGAAVQDLPDFRLVLVGDGVACESLQTLATVLGLNNVIFLARRRVGARTDLSRGTRLLNPHEEGPRSLRPASLRGPPVSSNGDEPDCGCG